MKTKFVYGKDSKGHLAVAYDDDTIWRCEEVAGGLYCHIDYDKLTEDEKNRIRALLNKLEELKESKRRQYEKNI